MEFIMVIKNLRLQNAWSQEKLADMTGLSTRTIQRIEKEDKASLESLSLLAKIFNLDIQELQEKLNTNKEKETIQDNISNNKSEKSFFQKKKFKIFIAINLMLFTINMLTNSSHLWFLYPLLGWGIPMFYKEYIKPVD
jgi:transcriptional regulator with XRE-family HTH domain